MEWIIIIIVIVIVFAVAFRYTAEKDREIKKDIQETQEIKENLDTLARKMSSLSGKNFIFTPCPKCENDDFYLINSTGLAMEIKCKVCKKKRWGIYERV